MSINIEFLRVASVVMSSSLPVGSQTQLSYIRHLPLQALHYVRNFGESIVIQGNPQGLQHLYRSGLPIYL